MAMSLFAADATSCFYTLFKLARSLPPTAVGLGTAKLPIANLKAD